MRFFGIYLHHLTPSRIKLCSTDLYSPQLHPYHQLSSSKLWTNWPRISRDSLHQRIHGRGAISSSCISPSNHRIWHWFRLSSLACRVYPTMFCCQPTRLPQWSVRVSHFVSTSSPGLPLCRSLLSFETFVRELIRYGEGRPRTLICSTITNVAFIHHAFGSLNRTSLYTLGYGSYRPLL